jgi:hypothetical protein
MVLAKDIRQYDTVKTWLQGLREQWGREPEDVEARLEALKEFCQFVGRDPDTIIAECVREAEGGKRIRLKGRRFYNEKIAEFQASVGGDSRTRAQWGNTIRSFLIHNGIFLQSGLQM